MIAKSESVVKERLKEFNRLAKDAAGTPDQWIDRFRRYIDLGVSQFILSIPNPLTMIQDMELLAEFVIPNL